MVENESRSAWIHAKNRSCIGADSRECDLAEVDITEAYVLIVRRIDDSIVSGDLEMHVPIAGVPRESNVAFSRIQKYCSVAWSRRRSAEDCSSIMRAVLTDLIANDVCRARPGHETWHLIEPFPEACMP